MQARLKGQSPQRQQFDALMVAINANALTLAQAVAAQLRAGDRSAVAEQLRYIASLIDAQ